MESGSSATISETPGNSAMAAPTGAAAVPSTPRPQPALHPGDARRSILGIRESSDGRSSSNFEENLPGASISSPSAEAAKKRVKRETVAVDGPQGEKVEEAGQDDVDMSEDEPRFTNTSRVLFRASDLLPSSPAARSGSPAPAADDDIGSGDDEAEADVGSSTPGDGGIVPADGPQALFPTTQLCFDDEFGPGRIWNPVNLRGEADPHWREVPHNPDHPPVPGEGTCHLCDLSYPDSSLPAIIHEYTSHLASQGTLFAATINNLHWATSVIENCGYDFDAGPAQLKLPKPRRQRLESPLFVFPTTGANPFMGYILPRIWGGNARDLLRPSQEMNELREGLDVPDALPSTIFGGAEFKRRENSMLISGPWRGEVTPMEQLGKGLVEFPWSSGRNGEGKVAEENVKAGEGDGDREQQEDKDGEKKASGRPSPATARDEDVDGVDKETGLDIPDD